MKKTTVFISLFTSLLLLSVTVLFLTPEAYAITWNDFTQSMNQAFSKKNVFTVSNLVFLTIILIITISLILIIRFDTIRTDEIRRQAYQEVQKDLLAKRELFKSSDNRAWFRMPIQMQFKWQHWPEEDHVKPRKFPGIALDISGGGMLFQTTELLNVQDEIKVWITIDETPIELIAQVVRTQEKLNENAEKKYLVGVKFIDIREGIRDKIIAWVLKCQTEFLALHDDEEISPQASATLEEKIITDDDPSSHDEEAVELIEPDPVTFANDDSIYDEEASLSNLSSLSKASFSGILHDNKVELFINLEDKEPIKLNGKILNTAKNNSKSTIITLEIDE